MRYKNLLKLVLPIVLFSVSIQCDKNSSEPKETIGNIQGTVKNAAVGEASQVHPAYLFYEDSLLTTTDESGNYTIKSFQEGTYSITCSAVNFSDTTIQVKVVGGKTVTQNFNLTPDASIGRIYGEFQDNSLFTDSLKTNPDLATWDAKKIMDEATGATLCTKILQQEIPDLKVFLGDSLLGTDDGWGQFWFKVQAGTYCFKGSCEGYKSDSVVVKILPDTKHYITFNMNRLAPAKLVSK
jgi:hypothetical protein